MKENILIVLIFIAVAFSSGVMVAGGLLPAGAVYGVIGGLVLISIMALFVGGLIAVVYIFKRHERPQHPEPYRDYRPFPDRAIHGQFDRPAIDHQHVHRWPARDPEDPRRELPTPTKRAIPWKK
jgi:uncharacterized membrane protein